MNSNNIKNFATWARTHLLEATTRQAAVYGIKASGIDEVRETGDAVIINGNVFDRKIRQQRARLVDEVKSRGFDQVVDEVAYTWFNRLCALRFMEVNDYLPTGIRILSSSEDGKTEPDVLTQALSVDLPINKDDVYRLLDSHKEDELYRRLLIAQCNALNEPLPFLFEKISDYTEILLPEGLLHPGGLIDRLVSDIPEEDWREIEIVGWLYQFYIKDKKDQVIGKVVKKEDIPAATQLFTPRWIVEYMVQNSLGRLWLEMYPDSPLRGKMKYYIENPDDKDLRRDPMPLEEIKCLDNACGSGHILVVMFDLLFQMYEERGYVARDIPALILNHNITGIDIDRRACQLASFAVAMKAREKDRRFLERGVHPHVIEILESNGLDPQAALQIERRELAAFAVPERGQIDAFSKVTPWENSKAADRPQIAQEVVRALAGLFTLFHDAKNYGSLLTIPDELTEQLPALSAAAEEWRSSEDTFTAKLGEKVLPLVDQAEALAMKYHVVVANPPYMGGKGMNSQIKDFAKRSYPDAKADLFAMFIERNIANSAAESFAALITMQSWMFLSSYEKMRISMLDHDTIINMVHLGARAFDTIGGEVVATTTFVIKRTKHPDYRGAYIRVTDGASEEDKRQMVLSNTQEHDELRFQASVSQFRQVPGVPIAYWLSDNLRSTFTKFPRLEQYATIRAGLQTGDNDSFVRCWHEVNRSDLALNVGSRQVAMEVGCTWFPLNKGGGFRKWSGNSDLVLNWCNDGEEIKRRKAEDLKNGKITPNNSKCWNQEFYFKSALSWSAMGTGKLSVRANGVGYIFDTKGQSLFPSDDNNFFPLLGLLHSSVVTKYLEALSPTLDFNGGNLAKIPVVLGSADCIEAVRKVVTTAHEISVADWNNYEFSWGFTASPLLSGMRKNSISASWSAWSDQLRANITRMRELETENNRLWIEAYGLQDELSSEVSEEEITLARPDLYKDMAAFVSYAIGCMMGRYSLDKPGLILADAGDTFKKYVEKIGKPLEEIAFPADKDAIIPVLDAEYFSDDCAGRLFEFIKITFGPQTLDENLDFLADAIVTRKKNESSRDAIRRYLATQFFKDHCQTYKNRPIYWMFTSGKERAFQALVYMHRYRPDTIARMRTEYLHELQKKLEWEEGHLEDAAEAGGKTGRDAEKKLKTLRAQLKELKAYDEKLRHYAEMQIDIDLDDGVKSNYRKFKELLAPVQGVTTGKDKD